MVGNVEASGSEFDAWMRAGPSVKVAAGVEDVDDAEVAGPAKGKGRVKGKRGAVIAGLARKPTVLIPAIIAVAAVGLMVLRNDGAEPAQAEGQYAAIATAPTDAVPGVLPASEANIYDQAAPVLDEPPVPVDTIPEASTEPEPVLQSQAEPVAIAETPDVEPELEPVAAAAHESAEKPTRHELKLRIAALQNDLDRAQQTREANLRTIRGLRAELERREGQGSYSVIAVLNDGVVVRDGSGSERVYGLGARIGE